MTITKYQRPISTKALRGQICTEFGTGVGVADLNTCEKIGDRLGCVDFVGVTFCPFPLTSSVAVNTCRASATAQPVKTACTAYNYGRPTYQMRTL